MATEFLSLVPSKIMEDAQTSQFVVSNPQVDIIKAIIDSCAVTNISTSSSTFNINIVPVTLEADSSNLLVNQKRLEPGETYLCPEILGQVLEEGFFISTLAGAADTFSIAISGRQITS